MKKVCFLLPEGELRPSSVIGAIEIFEMANEYLVETGSEKYYNITIVGASHQQDKYGLSILPVVKDLRRIKPDLIIVPGMHWENHDELKGNKLYADWLCKQYTNGSEIASLCTGAFFLAASGILEGKECSTHWQGEQEFVKRFPNVKLNIHKVITDSKGIYTAGGANSSLNLILYLIEKYNGRQAAVYCAKMLQIDIDRSSQSPFVIFNGLRDHEDETIKRVQLYVEKNSQEKLTVEFLADKFSMSKRSFIRRFKKVTLTTPIDYIQKVKMETAKRRFETNKGNINEVMYAVGYNDTKAFRNIFRKVTGLSPTEYKQKFKKGLV
jgi:transcriptional regulator GlxA family with amidase domain